MGGKYLNLRNIALAALALAVLAQDPGGGVTGPALAARSSRPLVVVMMENQDYDDVVGSPRMPYFNRLWQLGMTRSGPVTDYLDMHSIISHSLPNYLAITSGSTWGIRGGTVVPGMVDHTSLWDQLTAAGISWDVYQEGMPAACATGDDDDSRATNGEYVLRHNPGTIYGQVDHSAECDDDRPLSALSSALPDVSFVTPNLCDDDHGLPAGQAVRFTDCVTGSAALLRRGDDWLSRLVPRLTDEGADVLITWDEGGHLASMMTGPGVDPGPDVTYYTHYSVLAGIETGYGLPLLGNASSANPLPVP